jgi:glutamate-5-semialdehyde dehydrogenase
MTDLNRMGVAAKDAAQSLATTSTKQKNTALLAIADALEAEASALTLDANAQDIADGRARGLSEAMLDRLLLNEVRLAALAADVRKVVGLRDPVGEEMDGRLLPNGMRLVKRRIPLGVVGVIYEARPNVTVDVASLCLKTGNASILRGGSETLRSNLALVRAIQRGLATAGLPEASVQYVDNPDRVLVTELLRLDRYVDMIIRRRRGAPQACRSKGSSSPCTASATSSWTRAPT